MQLCDRIEKDINEAIPRSEVYIHAEPQDSSHLQSEGDKQGRYYFIINVINRNMTISLCNDGYYRHKNS